VIEQLAMECAHDYRLAFPDLDVPLCVFYVRAVCPAGVLLGEWCERVLDALDILDEVDDMVKASDKRIEAVRAMVNRGKKQSEIAACLGISICSVSNICRKNGIKSKLTRRCNLVTDEMAREWYEMKQGGVTGCDIAEGTMYNMATVNRHIRRYGELVKRGSAHGLRLPAFMVVFSGVNA